MMTFGLGARGQGFVNLDFESTSLSPNGPPGTVATDIGLPGWTVLIDGIPESSILYNNGTLGNSAVAILGTGNSLSPIIEGNFSAMLIAGANPTDSISPADSTISQTGLVPLSTRSLVFEAYAQGNPLSSLYVTLNGQAIGIVPLSVTPNYTLWGGDVSVFAGGIANLAITAHSNYPQGFEVFGLDAISFSTDLVPEPSTLGLFSVGAVLLGFGLARRRRLCIC